MGVFPRPLPRFLGIVGGQPYSQSNWVQQPPRLERGMLEQRPCEQFGMQRAEEIEDLIEAATGSPCAGRHGGTCPLAAEAEAPAVLALRVVS